MHHHIYSIKEEMYDFGHVAIMRFDFLPPYPEYVLEYNGCF